MPIVWVELRHFLESRGAELTQHSSRLVVMTLAPGFYDEPEDRVAAIESSQLIMASYRRDRTELRADEAPTQGSSQSSHQGAIGDSTVESLLSHDIFMRFKASDKKFPGDLG